MDNNELEKYLNCLIRQMEYYYYEALRLRLSRFDDGGSHFRAEFPADETICHYETVRYYRNNRQPYWCPCDFSFVKAYFILLADETYTYKKGISKISYSSKEAMNFFEKRLKDILDEYLEKNNMEYITLSFIHANFSGYKPQGSILIHTPTEIFELRSYNRDMPRN